MAGTFRYLSYDDTVRMDIRMADVVPIFEDAYRRIAAGGATVQPRVRLVNPPLAEGQGRGRPWDRDLRILPAIVPGLGTACRLGASARSSHGSGVLLIYWDYETMALRCVISDELVHGVRSAAPDGPFTKYCARADANVLGVIGTGRISRWATEACCSQRDIRTVKVFSRDPSHRADFCAFMSSRLGLDVVDCRSSNEAVDGADIVVMSTATRVPVIDGSALKAGCTVISNTPEELDDETARRAARVVVAFREEVVDHIPPWQAVHDRIQSGELSAESLVPMPDIVSGKVAGRTSDDEIVVCLNPGSGVHDVAASRFVYDRAMERGLGVDLPT